MLIRDRNSLTLGTSNNGLNLSNEILQLSLATTDLAGAMAATDKIKLDAITNVGSGSIISTAERNLLNSIQPGIIVKKTNITTDLTINYNTITGSLLTCSNNSYNSSTSLFSLTGTTVTTLFSGVIELDTVVLFNLSSNNGGLQTFFNSSADISAYNITSTANVENANSSSKATLRNRIIVPCAVNQTFSATVQRETGNNVSTVATVLSALFTIKKIAG